MSEVQPQYEGESARAFNELVNDPNRVPWENVVFGPKKDRSANIGLALYYTPGSQGAFNHDVVKEYAVEFLRSLSVESYYNRFIAGKPTTERELGAKASHFIEYDERYHATIAVLHNNRMIAAASAFRPKFTDLKDYPIAEVSVTIGDLYQHMGLGGMLLERVTDEITDRGITHTLANFHAGNTRSINLLDYIFGNRNLVAGRENFEMRAYRLGVTDPKEDIDLETILRKLAGPGSTPVFERDKTGTAVKASRIRNSVNFVHRHLFHQTEPVAEEKP